MDPLFDHIDLRVSSLAGARAFYDAWLPALGLTAGGGGADWKTYRREGEAGRMPFIWMVEEPGHRGGLNRVAIYQPSIEAVNRIAELARAAGARNFEAPEHCLDYGDHYYAAYFEDADGNRWEISCRHVPAPTA